MDATYHRYDGEDFEAYFVISEDANFRPPTAEFCRQVRDRFGLTMPVLFDDTGELNRLGLPTSHFHMVWGEGSRIEYRQMGSDIGYDDAIDRLLER